jgi:hypothetical protein
MRPARLLIIFLALLAAVLFLVNGNPRTSRAQTDAPAAQEQPVVTKPDPPGIIDGAKNPELIPDETAWRLLFLAVAEPENATPEQIERARAKIAPAELSEEDTVAFLSLLTQFRKQSDALEAQLVEIYVKSPFPHPDSIAFKQLVELDKRRDQLFANTTAALPARLSPEGVEKLYTYLQEAKRGMKIIPPTNEDLMPK